MKDYIQETCDIMLCIWYAFVKLDIREWWSSFIEINVVVG